MADKLGAIADVAGLITDEQNAQNTAGDVREAIGVALDYTDAVAEAKATKEYVDGELAGKADVDTVSGLTAGDIAYGDGTVADTLNAEPELHGDAVSNATFNETTGTETARLLGLKQNVTDVRSEGAVRALAEAQITTELEAGGKITDALAGKANTGDIRSNADIDGRADARIDAGVATGGAIDTAIKALDIPTQRTDAKVISLAQDAIITELESGGSISQAIDAHTIEGGVGLRDLVLAGDYSCDVSVANSTYLAGGNASHRAILDCDDVLPETITADIELVPSNNAITEDVRLLAPSIGGGASTSYTAVRDGDTFRFTGVVLNQIPGHYAQIQIAQAITTSFSGTLNYTGVDGGAVGAVKGIAGSVKRTDAQVDGRADARIEEQIKTGGTIDAAIKAIEIPQEGLNQEQVDARVDAKQIPAVFQTVADTVPQQHPMTKFIVTPANSPLQTTPFTFSSDFAGVADGSVVKLGGVFHFGLNPSRGSLPLCSLIITQGTKHLRTFTNLNAQTGNDIQYLAQRGAGDIKFQPVVATTNELDQDVYPYLDVQDVAFTGVYHDILIEILNANIALATAETRGMLASVVGQVQNLSGLVQNTNDDVAALRATLDALVSKVDNPALNFLSQSTVSPATAGLTTERLPLGDDWDAEIVDHATIEPAFAVGAQEMRTTTGALETVEFNIPVLANTWFDANITSWMSDVGGSTGSAGAGPGTNSPGPYIHWEASGTNRHTATPITITGGSNADTDVKAWLDHNGARNIEFLYNYVSTASAVSIVPAFFVAEQLDKDGAVIATREYSDWVYNAAYAQGATIDLETGTNFVSELPGGWRRVGMDLLPECRSVKLYNMPEGTGSGDFVNDLAFYDIRISESGLDTPSDNAAAGASGQAGATGQADGLVQGLIVELESGDLNYDTDAIARVRDGAVYGIRQVAEIPAGTRTVDNFTGASPTAPFSIALGVANQHANASQSFAPPQIIPANTTVRAHLSIYANDRDEADFTLDYVWGSGAAVQEVFTLGTETLTVIFDELNGQARIRTVETGGNNLGLDGGQLTGYFSFSVATPKIDATTEEVRLQGHSGLSVLGFTDSVTNPTLVIYYGNGAQFDTGLTNRDFLDHYILTTSGNPGAFRIEVATVDAFNVSALQANYAAGVRYLGLFRDKAHHTQLFGFQGGITFIKRDGVEANLEDELAKGGGGSASVPTGARGDHFEYSFPEWTVVFNNENLKVLTHDLLHMCEVLGASLEALTDITYSDTIAGSGATPWADGALASDSNSVLSKAGDKFAWYAEGAVRHIDSATDITVRYGSVSTGAINSTPTITGTLRLVIACKRLIV